MMNIITHSSKTGSLEPSHEPLYIMLYKLSDIVPRISHFLGSLFLLGPSVATGFGYRLGNRFGNSRWYMRLGASDGL